MRVTNWLLGVQDVALQPDGKILVGGLGRHRPSAANRFFVVRLNGNGTIDRSFGRSGVIRGVEGKLDSTFQAVKVDWQGRVYVAASQETGDGSCGLLLRYTNNGTPDTTFGEQGRFSLGCQYEFADVLLMPDGRTAVTGVYGQPDRLRQSFVAMIKPDGKLDPQFGSSGIFTIMRRDWEVRTTSLALDHLGRIVVGATTNKASYSQRDMGNFLLFRLKANGRPDALFGNGGIGILGVTPYYDSLSRVAVAANHDLVAVGSAYSAGSVVVVSLLPDGRRKARFGANGFVFMGDNVLSTISGLAIQPDGKILLSGTGPSAALVLRLLPDGKLDPSFHSGGFRPIGFGQKTSAGGPLAITPDGKLIVTGQVRLGWGVVGVARLLLN